MTTGENPNQDLETDRESDTDLVRHLRKEIRDRNARLNETQTRLAETEKRTAFQSVGLDVSSGVGKLAYEAYKGEATPEEVAKFAEEYGLKPAEPGSAPEQEAEGSVEPKATERHQDAEASRRIEDATTGSPPGDGKLNSREEALKARDEIYKTTGNAETANAAYFNTKLAAALEERNG